MLWLLVGIILLFWLFGQAVQFGGDLIHFLLLVVVALVIYNLVVGRRPRA